MLAYAKEVEQAPRGLCYIAAWDQLGVPRFIGQCSHCRESVRGPKVHYYGR